MAAVIMIKAIEAGLFVPNLVAHDAVDCKAYHEFNLSAVHEACLPAHVDLVFPVREQLAVSLRKDRKCKK